ncbi:unnamed protein product, partial [Closterium sp. NIES-54]
PDGESTAHHHNTPLSHFAPLFPTPPETEQGVAQAVLRSQVDLKRDPWPKVSDGAKHLVMLMLQPDTSKRPTAQQVLRECFLSPLPSLCFLWSQCL